MTTSELALLDTNILVYAADERSAFHASAKQRRDRGMQGEISFREAICDWCVGVGSRRCVCPCEA